MSLVQNDVLARAPTRDIKDRRSKDIKDRRLGLTKSDIINDRFNNPLDPDEEKNSKKSPIRLMLSKSAKHIHDDLKIRIQEFLKENRDVEKGLQFITVPLEDSLYEIDPVFLNVRRMAAYHDWMLMIEGKNVLSEGGISLEERKPYLKVHECKKDIQIRSLYEEHQKLCELILSQRQGCNPEYYYIVHGKAYGFN